MDKTFTYNQPKWLTDLLENLNNETRSTLTDDTKSTTVPNHDEVVEEPKVFDANSDLKFNQYSIEYWRAYFLTFKNL